LGPVHHDDAAAERRPNLKNLRLGVESCIMLVSESVKRAAPLIWDQAIDEIFE